MIAFLLIMLVVSVVVNAVQLSKAIVLGSDFKAMVKENVSLEKRIKALRETPVQPKCQCGHVYAFHAKDKCLHKPDIRKFNSFLEAWYFKCPCTGYTGPEPLPEYYHPLALEK